MKLSKRKIANKKVFEPYEVVILIESKEDETDIRDTFSPLFDHQSQAKSRYFAIDIMDVINKP